MVEIREKSTNHLPIDNSLIPFDLLFRVGLAHASDEELTIKALFSDLPHSEMGMRYHFKRLLDRGWIDLHPSPHDKRSKIVSPNEKLLARLADLEEELSTLLSDLAPKIIDSKVSIK